MEVDASGADEPQANPHDWYLQYLPWIQNTAAQITRWHSAARYDAELYAELLSFIAEKIPHIARGYRADAGSAFQTYMMNTVRWWMIKRTSSPKWTGRIGKLRRKQLKHQQSYYHEEVDEQDLDVAEDRYIRTVNSYNKPAEMLSCENTDIEHIDLADGIGTVLARLPVEYKVILMFRVVQAHTSEELAEFLGVCRKTADRLYNAAIEQAREIAREWQ